MMRSLASLSRVDQTRIEPANWMTKTGRAFPAT